MSDITTATGPRPLKMAWTASAPTHFVDNARKFLEYMLDSGKGEDYGYDFDANPDVHSLIYHDASASFYTWMGSHWEPRSPRMIESVMSDAFSAARFYTTNSKGERQENEFIVNNKILDNLMRALRNTVMVPGSVTFNSWVTGDGPDPADLVVCQNGLLNVRTRELTPHSPRFFNLHTTTFDYDANAPAPTAWLKFTSEALEEDPERISLIQEWMGYVLTLDTSRQKIMSLIGVPGSGKGTTLRVIQDLVGRRNVGASGIVEMGEPHGLQSIVHKPLVVLSDVQSTGRNANVALERLANISGEDTVTVNPKNQKPYEVLAPCRFMMASNRVPNLPDRDGALQRRLLVLAYQRSFSDAPDPDLSSKLRAELPGILNWAIDGLDALRQRGQFVQPEIGAEHLDLLADGAAPEQEFARECCVFGEEHRESKADLYTAWDLWRQSRGYEKRTMTTFVKALKSVHPKLDPRQKTSVAEGRRPAIGGIALTNEACITYCIPVRVNGLTR